MPRRSSITAQALAACISRMAWLLALPVGAVAQTQSIGGASYTYAQVRLNEADLDLGDPNRQVTRVYDGGSGPSRVSRAFDVRSFDSHLNALYQVDGGHAGDANPTRLKSETWLTYGMDVGWSSVRASAYTSMVMSERFAIDWGGLTPQPDWVITWQWNVHGHLGAQLDSVPGPYGQLEFGNMRYQHIVSADVDMHWSFDGQNIEKGSVYSDNVHRSQWEHTIDEMRRGQHLLPLGGSAGVPTTTPYSDTQQKPVPRAPHLFDITVGTATYIETWFTLSTAVNLGLYNVDSSASLSGVLEASFLQTAELTTIQLRDGQGRPIYGDWRLVPESGAWYPVQNQPVPEPGTWALLALGLAALARRARGRR